MEYILNIIKIFIGSFCLLLYSYSNLFFIYNSINFLSFDNYITHLFNKNHRELNLVKTETNELKEHFSCVSYNIHMGFDIFNNYKIKEIIIYLNKLNADFICLQEVLSREQFEYIRDSLHYDYDHYGGDICIFSKYKIIKNHNIYYDNLGIYENNNFLVSKINVNDTILYLVNIHLLNDITFYKQKKELKEIMNFMNLHLDHYKDKVLMLGDFNYSKEFTDIYTYMFEYVNTDKSFPSIYPLMKLDKGYFKNIKLLNYKVDDIYYSDHKPFYSEIKLD